MNYSQTSIANAALGRIGARGQITDINEPSPNAKKILIAWNHVFQEVLAERDWRFAKTRTVLELSPVKPLYAYCSAWLLPGDLLRFVRPHKRPPDRAAYAWFWGPEGDGWYHRNDPPFWPTGYPYVIEAVLTNPDDPANGYNQCVLTDYRGQCGPAKVNYIRLITDLTQLMPGFVNCLTYRLAAEVAVAITEDGKKAEGMMSMYRDSLNSAEAQNECLDYQKDEAGSESWERAGRFAGYGGWGVGY